METLIKIARYTGEKKYLEPIPRALEYFKKCLLPDGQGRPVLRVQDEQAALHGRAVPAHLRRLRRPEPLRLEAARPLRRRSRRRTRTPRAARDPAAGPPGQESGGGRPQDHPGARRARGAGSRPTRESGSSGSRSSPPAFRYLSSDVFSRNVETLSEYVARIRPSRPATWPPSSRELEVPSARASGRRGQESESRPGSQPMSTSPTVDLDRGLEVLVEEGVGLVHGAFELVAPPAVAGADEQVDAAGDAGGGHRVGQLDGLGVGDERVLGPLEGQRSGRRPW